MNDYAYIVCTRCGHVETVPREHARYVEGCEFCRTREHATWECGTLEQAERVSERVLRGEL